MSSSPVSPQPPAPQPTPAGERHTPLRNSTNVQGNVLAAFNKDHAAFLLISLPPPHARPWLGELTPLVAHTKQVEDFNDRFSASRRAKGGHDPLDLHEAWLGLSLTVAGLGKLVSDVAQLQDDLQAFPSFASTPAAQAARLGDTADSAPDHWLFGGPVQPTVDAILTLAADRSDDLQALEARVEQINQRHGATVTFRQPGEVLPRPATGHEHFGFRDGISQPGVRGFHQEDPLHRGQRLGHPGQELIAPGEFVLGYPNQQGQTVAVADWLHDGSFAVLRRLAQDVPGFWESVAHSCPHGSPAEREKRAAKLVGRWRSGASLAHHPQAAPPPFAVVGEDNAFDYQAEDPDGLKTPRFSHIRKVHPRDALPPGAGASERRRIMRRGIPFGARFDPTGLAGAGAGDDRGLVFACFQASIENQFEFLQRAWANDPRFPQGDGPDPVIGHNDHNRPVTLRRDDGHSEQHTFKRFVTTQGALYAFAPALRTLARLAAGEI